jgi:metallo-beta-lactamase family protein
MVAVADSSGRHRVYTVNVVKRRLRSRSPSRSTRLARPTVVDVTNVPTIAFLGGARTVTGSKYLVRTAGGRQILVDCGLFQGRKELRLRNWAPFEVSPASIDAVVLTHAHVDHCGSLPRLVNEGFSGPVFATRGTARLTRIVLPDSGHLHEEEAAYANRKGYSKHRPALPLYTRHDAVRSLEQLVEVPFHRRTTVVPGVEITFRHAGHILGAATLDVSLVEDGRTIAFSGDLGRFEHPLLRPPDPIDGAEVVVCESTYGAGDRVSHDADDVDEVLVEVITEAARRGGVVVVPAFAVDRTEIVLHHLDRLTRTGAIPDLPVFVDSPMASSALQLYRDEARRGSSEFRDEFRGAELFGSINLTETRSVEESKALSARHGPMIIVSASGMATGGRVLHHLAGRLGDNRNTVLLVGFQAPGTRGEQLASGAREVKLLGSYRPVLASVRSLRLSAHASRDELASWLSGASIAPRVIYLTHGEEAASEALAAHLSTISRARIVVPHHGDQVRLDPASLEA